MKKFILIIAVLLVASTFAYAGGGNVLANGEISIAAAIAPSTNSVTVGVYGSGVNSGKEWSKVYAVALKNNSLTTTVTTVTAVDLDLTTAIGAPTTNLTTASSLINIVSAPIPAKEVTITVVIPTNSAATTVEYFIYAD